jgi:hypothetical protein
VSDPGGRATDIVLARAAILAAAEFLEMRPDLYDDTSMVIPWTATEPASAKGWIGYFAGLSPRRLSTVGVEFGVLGYQEANGFHGDMEEICKEMGWRGWLLSWRTNARLAARCLRKLADERYAGRVAG